MTLRHLKIFIAVADTGTMSAAAEQCFLSQPTVSQTIRELETHYDTLLFERLSKKLYITPSGTRLLQYARKVVAQSELLESAMLTCHTHETLRIGATITVGACLLSQALLDLQRQIPDLEVTTCVTNTSIIEQKLLNSELDVGLVEGMVLSPDLRAIPVAEDFLVLAAAKDHPLALKKHIRLSDLSDQSFALREKGSGTRRLFEEYMVKNKIPYKIAWEANCPQIIKNAVLYNSCLSAISVRLLESDILSDRLHVIVNDASDWDRSFFLVCHKDKLMTPGIHALEKIMHKYKRPDFLEYCTTGLLV